MKIFTSLVLAGLLFGTSYSVANDVKESVKETAQDAKKTVKKGTHRVQEEGCEMVNGKMECAGKKIKNRATEVKDEVKDMAN
ncbi:hypothetical protein B9G69_002045 [Bdellovibrio sp. SKB1291214]|uniref:hypothetical protein n=1 Tax=Bdellovibrio sp. SKB1291214 TaxID=1732569 RepID=UPI000B515782|nr:hypothetical protein [Bdellovibrio sp. SKB1291214]UYL09352.1 hypothetical protein B9G69_002045 [Bdellovibrio sp. SKB1291214]